MLTKKVLKVIGATTMVAASTTLFLGSAYAAERRGHSSTCTAAYDNQGTSLYNGYRISTTSSTGKYIYCPVATDSYLQHSAATQINVHGYEASGSSNFTRACVKHFNNSGTACGATRYWGSTYSGGASVDVSAWNSYGASFPYLYQYIDKSGQYFGYWFRN